MNRLERAIAKANQRSTEYAVKRFRIEDVDTSRRDLLSVSRKLIYVAPFVQVFCASRALAASGVSGPSCVPMGGLCGTDADCCDGDCDAGTCQ